MGDTSSPLADTEARLRTKPGGAVRRLSGRGVATFPGRPGRPRQASSRPSAAPSAGIAVQRTVEPKAPPIAASSDHLAHDLAAALKTGFEAGCRERIRTIGAVWP